jgi:hypothetical protein
MVATVLTLSACSSKSVPYPHGSIPKRGAVGYDAFGGYITVETSDQGTVMGEFIGLRNDSVVIVGSSPLALSLGSVRSARVVTYQRVDYRPAFLFLIPSVLLLARSGDEEFGESYLAMGLIFTGIGAIAVTATIAYERSGANYHELSEGWAELSKYSRFPAGIPSNVVLSTLEGREFPAGEGRRHQAKY